VVGEIGVSRGSSLIDRDLCRWATGSPGNALTDTR